jgi:TRAP-type transport system periplasmic protein
MKRFVVFFTGTLLALFLSGDCLAGDEPRIVIKMATMAPQGSQASNIVEELSKQVQIKTNNEVGFKVYWGGVQGDEKDVIRKIRLGQLQGGSFIGPSLGTIVPQVLVTELPYVFWNHDEVAYVRSRLENTMTKLFEEKGFVVLGWMDLGFVYSFSKIPITSLEIARKQKWWSMEGDPVGRSMYNVMNITPISLSISDVATALSTNLIDCAPSTTYGAVAFRWYTRFKYMSDAPSANVLGATLISKETWDKISPGSRKIILDIARKEHEKVSAAVRRDNAKSLELLKKAGVKIVSSKGTDSKEVEYIFDVAKKARESLIGKLYSKELLNQTLMLVEEYRKNHPKYIPDAILN